MTPLETLSLADTRSQVVIAPSRGGMVTRFSVDGRPLLYLDDSTLVDPTKNVRGGNPILFPSPGPLTADAFARVGRRGSMKQHGIARQRPWEVQDRDRSSARLVLRSSEETHAAFPWNFEIVHHHTLADARLTITQQVRNQDDTPMPFAMGFHPYFFVPDADKARTTVPTNAHHAWDNVAKQRIQLTDSIRLTEDEVDLRLEDHTGTEATLVLPDGATVVVSASPAYQHWVVWTLAGKDFVCLEPWTAPADALNTGHGLLVVEPGASVELTFAIELR